MNNFWIRTISSIVFLIVMVFGLIWDRVIFGALFLFILYCALNEFYNISLGSRYRVQQKLGLLAGTIAFFTVALHCFYGIDARFICLALLPLLLIPASCVFLGIQDDFQDVSLIYAGLLYIALPISLSPYVMMDGPVFNGWLMLSFFIVIWLSDAGAYCFGSMFGQKEGAARLAPSISPKKSWVGFWCGLACAVVASIVLHYLTWFPFPLVHSIVLGVLISFFGVCGDLFESQWKRHFHVKDSGNIIPGHGGMLDRFDSSLIAIPAAVLYLSIFGLL